MLRLRAQVNEKKYDDTKTARLIGWPLHSGNDHNILVMATWIDMGRRTDTGRERGIGREKDVSTGTELQGVYQ